VKTIKIGTFNLYNLHLPDVVYYEDRRYSQVEYERKRAWLAARLDSMEADIVGFQEIWRREALEDVLARTVKFGEDRYLTASEPETDGIFVGLVSRFPVTEADYIADLPASAAMIFEAGPLPIEKFSRPVLRASVELPEIGVARVFVAHLKSKRPEFLPNEDPDDFHHDAVAKARALVRRAVEAVGLRHLLLAEMSNNRTPVIVLGDLNDIETSVTTDIVAGSPPFAFDRFAEKRATWDRLLYNTIDLQRLRSRYTGFYTHIYNGHYEVLDHVLLSEEFHHANPAHLATVEYASIFNDHLVDLLHDASGVPVWQSDHGQVVATLRSGRE
jgi:endonuclease/exonuclease/phosphatase family metal-dependent hydrolase